MRIGTIVICLLMSACSTVDNASRSRPQTPGADVRNPADILSTASAADWIPLDPEETVYLDLPEGRVVIALSPYLAKRHNAQLKILLREHYFDGLSFYRVIEGFVAQAGSQSDDKSIGTATDSLVSEFDESVSTNVPFYSLHARDGYAPEVGFVNGQPAGRDLVDGKIWMAHCAGALAFARGNGRNTASSTIYFALQPQRYLDRNLTVVGRVVRGMQYIQSIRRAPEDSSGIIRNNDDQTRIQSFRLAADVPAADRIELEMMDTNSAAFAELVGARSNRPEEFFFHRPDYIDLCQMPVPVRRGTLNQ